MKALGKAFWLALGRAPHNWVTTASLCALPPTYIKLNVVVRTLDSLTLVCYQHYAQTKAKPQLLGRKLTIQAETRTRWLTLESSRPSTCFQSSWSAEVEGHLHCRSLQVRKKINRHVCFDRFSSRRKNVFPDFVCECPGIFLCEEHNPDLHLLSVSALPDRSLDPSQYLFFQQFFQTIQHYLKL